MDAASSCLPCFLSLKKKGNFLGVENRSNRSGGCRFFGIYHQVFDFFIRLLRIENKIKPEIFDEKRGNAALLIKNFGFYFVRDPKAISRKE